jgi:NADPH:quinone reductase-like Zn-dependent oxidoreductase
VEKVFALEQIAEAHRLSEAGHVRGKLVISIRG